MEMQRMAQQMTPGGNPAQALPINPQMQPLIQAYQQIKAGGNPAQIVQQMFGQDPQAQQFLQSINSGTPVQSLVDQMLKQSGMTREQAMQTIQQFGL